MKDVFPLDITFLHPGAAWLALLLVPLLLHDLWWRPARRVTRVHRALRAAVFLCVIAALMQPGFIWRKAGQRQMLVVDRRVASGRLEAVNGAIHRLILQAGRDAHVTLVEVGTGPAVAADETGIAERLRVEGNSLSAALDTALSHVPVGSKDQVTVIGDGASSDAHWGRAIDGFLRRGWRSTRWLWPDRARRAGLLWPMSTLPRCAWAKLRGPVCGSRARVGLTA
jgi:hypothetical protein